MKNHLLYFKIVLLSLFITQLVYAGSYPGVFSFDTVGDARVAWSSNAGDDDLISIGDDPEFGRYLSVVSPMAYGGCYEDVSWDLSACDVISFMMNLSDHGMTGVIGVYFKSGSGYYTAFIEVFGSQRKAAGWQRISLPKSIFGTEGTVIGWSSISQLTITLFPDNDFPESPDITIKLTDFHLDAYSEIGNLLKNSSFEYATTDNIPDGWGYGHWGIQRDPWASNMNNWRTYWKRTSETSYDGSFCMRLQNISDTSFPEMVIEGVWLRPCNYNLTHSFSAYMKCASGTASVQMSMGNYSNTVTVGTTWTRYIVTGVPGVATVSPQIKLLTRDQTIFIDAVQLESGSTPTSYRRLDSDSGFSTTHEAFLNKYVCRLSSQLPILSPKTAITAAQTISIDSSGRYMVNSKPFIPFAYGSEVIPSVSQVQLIAETGFNSICLMIIPSYSLTDVNTFCDICALNGLYIIPSFHSSISDATMTNWINSLKSNPAILAWYVLDEPTNPQDTAIQARINAAKTADSSRPAYVNYVKGQYNSGNLPGDIASIDDYVIPWSCPYRNGIAGKIMVDAVASVAKPAWAWMQGSGSAYWLDREPASIENTCMVYLNLVYGVRGFKYFAGIPFSDALWQDMNDLSQELNYLEGVLYDTTAPPTVTVSNSSVKFCVKSHNNKTYIIAVNSTIFSLSASFSGIGITGDWATVSFENRLAKIMAGQLTDTFGPYARHVYVLTQGNLKHLWDIEETSGATVLTDKSGSNNTTSLGTGQTIVSGPQKLQNVLCFDGINGTNRTAANLSMPAGGFTISLWLKPEDVNYTEAGLLWHENATKSFILKTGYASGRLCIGAYPDGATLKQLQTSECLTNNIWTHVAVTYDGVTCKIYIDGSLDVESTWNMAWQAKDTLLWFGQFIGRNFKGDMDDIRIYDAALDTYDIRALIISKTKPVHKWDIEETSDATVLTDKSGSNNTTTLGTGQSIIWADQKPKLGSIFNHALSFDGINGTNRTAANLSMPAGGFTISLWLKPEDVNYTEAGLLWHENATKSFILKTGYASGRLCIGAYPDGATLKQLQTSECLTNNIWTHVAVTYDGVTCKIYIDGSLDVESTWNMAWQAKDTLLWFGQFIGRNFKGDMDDVMLFDRALSDKEIGQLLDKW